MYAGHAAMGLALSAKATHKTRAVVALLVGASLAADIGWCLLTLATIEGGRSLGSQAFHAPRLPWSHSLLSTAVLALAFAGASVALADRPARVRLASLAAVAVFAHWLLGDIPFGEAFPVTPWSAPLPTPHLYAHWLVAFVIEAAIVAACAALAAPMLGRRRAAFLLVALLALHLLAWLPSFVGRPPLDLDVEPAPILGYLALLLAAGAACVVATPRLERVK